MANELLSWNELTRLTQGEAFDVERVRMKRSGVALEGRFELPALASMTEADQIFVAAFLRSHGSIKEMERLFGISYPTVKARLTKISEQLPFVENLSVPSNDDEPEGRPSRKEILDRLANGKITVREATKLIRETGKK